MVENEADDNENTDTDAIENANIYIAIIMMRHRHGVRHRCLSTPKASLGGIRSLMARSGGTLDSSLMPYQAEQ